ncbi:MAG: TonB-dependent receptor [Candidatus Omnitrophota bacterium]
MESQKSKQSLKRKIIGRLVSVCFKNGIVWLVFLNLIGLSRSLPAREVTGADTAGADTVVLGEIVVTATRTPHSLEELPVSISVVNRQEIDETGVQDVGQAISRLAGVKVNFYGGMGNSATPAIRGSSAEQTLILLDGRPLNLPAAGGYDLSLLPIETVEQIEILRGPASALYGANALGGVINIITRPIPKEPFFTSRLQFGTNETSLVGLSGGGKTGKVGYLFSSQFNATDGDREHSADREGHFSGKLSFDLSEKASLTVSAGLDSQKQEIPGSLQYPSPLAAQDTTGDWQDFLFRFTGGQGETTARLYLNNNKLHYQDPTWTTNNIINNKQVGLELQQNLSLGERHLLTVGAGYLGDSVNSVSTGKHTPDTRAVFIQDEVILPKGSFILSGRYDDHSIYGSEVSPRLAGQLKVSEKTILRASIGRSYRAPTVNELYWNEAWWPGAGMFGNSNVKPEEGISYEVGLSQRFNRKFTGKITLFRNDLDNLIQWVETIPFTRWDAQNVAKARLEGVETELDWDISPSLSLSLNHTYLKAANRTIDKMLPYRPENKLGLALTCQNRTGLIVRISGDYYDSAYADAANTAKMADYFLLGVNINKKVTDKLDVFLKGENLLGKKYEVIRGYPMPGTTLSAGIALSF